MKTILYTALLLVLSSHPHLRTQERNRDVEAIVAEGRERSKVMDHLAHLVTDIGPRLTGSDALTKACEWTRDQFASWGLEARLEEWGEFPVGFNRGPWSGTMIEPEKKSLTFFTSAWTPGTDGPLTAKAVMAPTNEREVVPDRLAGAWIIQLKEPARDLKKKIHAAYDEAKIAGVISPVKGNLIEARGNHKISWDKLPHRVAIDMIQRDVDMIVKHLNDGKEVRLTFDIRSEWKKGPIKLYNVIADLKGTEKPEEYVVVSAHLDSWDAARGCTDNGTGVAAVMEAARILAAVGAKPRRTIRFILWTGEEQGLLGSLAYVAKHKDELKSYSVCLNQDLGASYIAGIPATKQMLPIFKEIFRPVSKIDPRMPFKIYPVAEMRGGWGSDHVPFLFEGVPGIEWVQELREIDRNAHHTQMDTLDKADPAFQRHSSVVVAVGAYGLANLDTLLPRDNVGGKAPQPRRLGIDSEGRMITQVSEGSVAERAGLREGDEILALGDMKVEDLDSLRAAIAKATRETRIRIRRNGKEQELTVRFDQ